MARFSKSVTPLNANGVWTSDNLVPEQADNVVGLVVADQSGTLAVQQSIDNGTNWDTTDTVAVAANTPVKFSASIVAPLVRVAFTNGATAQGTFRIATKFSSAGPR